MNDSQLLQTIAFNIKRLRTTQNISQEELAYRCGLSKNYFSDVERGTRNITINVLQKLIEGLNVDIKELFQNPN